MSGRAPRPPELAAAALCLTALAAAALGPHVARGGFVWDDWENAATTAHPPPTGFLGPVDLRTFAYRPLLAVLLAVPHAVLGPRPALHLALAALLAAGLSLALYALLRAAGLGRAHAGLAAALALLFPWSSATRLWATAAINQVAVVLAVAGVLASLRGLEARGRGRRRWRTAAIALLVAAVLTYEATAVPALLAVGLYAARAGRRAALRWWRAEALAIAAAMLYSAAATTRDVHGPAVQLGHAAELAEGAVAVLGRAALPVPGLVPAGIPAAALAAVLVAAAVRARALGRTDPAGSELRRWVGAAVAGAAVVAAGYAAFIPADARYTPLTPGVGNRVGLVPALGYALLVTAAAAALATLLLGRRRTAATALTVALAGAVGAGWLVRLREDAAAYRRSAAVQERVLRAVERAVPRPPAGTTIYTTGHPLHTAPGVPAFAASWDLNGAVKIRYGTGAVRAHPLRSAGALRCGPRSMSPAPTIDNEPEPPRYGRTVVVDVRRPGARPLARPRDCES